MTVDSLREMTLPDGARISRAPDSSRTLYLYLDESGNFDFGTTGTPYFIMTCVAMRRPFAACHRLMDLKYDLHDDGIHLRKFHATEDNNETRKAVFNVLRDNIDRFSAYSFYVDKTTISEEMRDPAILYARVFRLAHRRGNVTASSSRIR